MTFTIKQISLRIFIHGFVKDKPGQKKCNDYSIVLLAKNQIKDQDKQNFTCNVNVQYAKWLGRSWGHLYHKYKCPGNKDMFTFLLKSST